MLILLKKFIWKKLELVPLFTDLRYHETRKQIGQKKSAKGLSLMKNYVWMKHCEGKVRNISFGQWTH